MLTEKYSKLETQTSERMFSMHLLRRSTTIQRPNQSTTDILPIAWPQHIKYDAANSLVDRDEHVVVF